MTLTSPRLGESLRALEATVDAAPPGGWLGVVGFSQVIFDCQPSEGGAAIK
jgi:hypothetical protein